MIHPLIRRHAALVLVGLLYGINYSVVKAVTPQYILPFGFIALRIVLAAILFWLISYPYSEKIHWREDGKRVFLCAFFGVGINMLVFFKGLSMTSAVNASIIMTLTPIMVFLMSFLLLGERINFQKSFGLMLGLTGGVVITYNSGNGETSSSWIGDILVFLNASTYATYLVLVKPLMAKYKPLTIMRWIFLIGSFIVAPFGITQLQEVSWAGMPGSIYLNIVYVVVGVTVLVYLLNIWALKKVNPSVIGVYIYLQPVFAILIASLFYDEILTMKHLIASLLVFTGVGLVIFKF